MISGATMSSQQVAGKASGDHAGIVSDLSDVIVSDPLVNTRTQIPMLMNRPVITSIAVIACQPSTQPPSAAAKMQPLDLAPLVFVA